MEIEYLHVGYQKVTINEEKLICDKSSMQLQKVDSEKVNDVDMVINYGKQQPGTQRKQ